MHNALKDRYHNISEECIILFVDTCRICNEEIKQIPKHVGAKSPIKSVHFRDRFQVDLIDYQKDPQSDGNVIIIKRLMVLKDHHTRFLYLRALGRKEAKCVCYELDHILGMIGFPLTFHTDNGGEFTAKEKNLMMKAWNPECTTVTGRSRAPRDQGSVENINKMVKSLISVFGASTRKDRKKENWVRNLGQVMCSINSFKSSGVNSSCPYMHAFSMPFKEPLTLPREEVRKCSTVDKILSLSRNNKILTETFKSMGYHNGDIAHDTSQHLQNDAKVIDIVPDVTEGKCD